MEPSGGPFPRTTLATLLLLGVMACERSSSPIASAAPHAGSLTAFITDDLARALSPDGTLVLESPQSPDGAPFIAAERARELASAYV